MLDRLSQRQHRLLTALFAVLLVTGPLGAVLDAGPIQPVRGASTSAEWSQATDVTTATATDPQGNVYVNDDGGDTVNDGIIEKYDATGAKQYETTVASAPYNTIAASNTTLAVAASPDGFDAESNSTYLKSLYPENGTVRWEKTGHDYGDVQVHDGTVVALNRSGNTVEAYNATTGDRLWTYDYSGSANGGQDTLAIDSYRERVYLPVSDGQIHAIHATNGTQARTYTPTASVSRLVFDQRDRRLLTRYANDGSTLGVVNVTNSGFAFETNVTLQGGAKSLAYDAYSETFYHGSYNGGTPKLWAYNLSDLSAPDHYDTISTSNTPHAIVAHSTPGANTTVAAGTQSELQVYDSGQQAHALPERTSPDVVSGVVRTQSGAPCRNCTVRAMAVNYSALDVGPDEYDARAKDLLAEARNVTPDDWRANVSLTGSDGLYETTDARYVAVHTTDDWHPGTFYQAGVVELREDPDLDSPRTHVPAGDPVVLSIRDPTTSPFYQDDIDEDLPGVTDSGRIVVEQVGPGNSTLAEFTVETDPRVTTTTGKDHELARVSLDSGFYRIHVEGSSATVPLTVGDPESIASGYADDLRDRASGLSAHAQSVRAYRQNQTFSPRVTTTDAEGRFEFSISDPNLERVGLVAYRAPDDLTTDPQNLSLADVRAYYEVTNTTESVMVPAGRTTASVPAENLTVSVRETSTPPYLSPGRHANLSARLREYFQYQSFSDLPSALQQRLNNTSRQRLETVYQRLDNLSQENDRLRDRYETLLEQHGETTVEVDVDDASDAALRQRIRALGQSITELRSTLDSGNTGVSHGNDTLSSHATFDAPLSQEHVTVVGHWSNGTSFVVADQYVSLDRHTVSGVGFQSTTVHVEEYPVTASDPASLRFEYRVATTKGVGSETTASENPSTEGEIPELAAIDFSTLRPGPDDLVTVDVQPTSDSSFRRVEQATVYGPSGAELATSNISGGDTFSFTTSGAGRYTIRITISATDGTTVVETVYLPAGDHGRDRRASIRAASGPTGVYALTGSGFEDGTIDVTDAGDGLEVVGQLDPDADASRPRQVHVYLAGVQPGRTSDVSLRVVRGDERKELNQSVGVTIHSKRVSESAILYRDDNPVTDAGTRYGQFDRHANGTVVETYTDENGVVDVRTVASPSLWEQAIYEWRTTVPGFEVSLGAIF